MHTQQLADLRESAEALLNRLDDEGADVAEAVAWLRRSVERINRADAEK